MTHLRTFSSWTELALILALAVCSAGCGDAADGSLAEARLVTVTKGTLRITVTEGGDLESGNPVVIRSPIEGRTTILDMVPEGAYVKKGDFLIRLDASTLEDRLNTAETSLERARSDKAQAKESVEIQTKQNTESIKSASTSHILAQRALKGYLNGEYPLELRRLESAVLLAESDLVRAKGIAEASERLFKKKFLSGTELERDRLSHQRAQEEVDIAKGRLGLLKEWTRPDQITRLETEVQLKNLALARVAQQAKSEMVQREDILTARVRAHGLALEARDKLKTQFDGVEIHSPTTGLVVYAREKRRRHSGSEPISIGTDVREREEIIRIPDLSAMKVEIDIHESSIKKIKAGQRANIRVDAIQGQVFPGTVTQVSLVPSSQSSWMNPDLKVYTVMVAIEADVEGMKPGMHAQAEILVGDIANALQIPVQAVHQAGSKAFVYMFRNGKVELQEVELGVNNDSMVQVTKGLSEDDQVYLVPPADRPKLPAAEKQQDAKRTSSPGAAMPAGAAQGGGDHAGSAPKGGKMRGGGRGNMTPEQRKKMRERMAAMTPEERAEMMKKFRGGRRRGGETKPRNDQD